MRGQRRGQKGVENGLAFHAPSFGDERATEDGSVDVAHNEAENNPAILNQSVGHANHCIAIESRVAALPNIYDDGDINTIHSFSTPSFL